MKYLKYIILSLCLSYLLIGCEQDIDVYSGESSIYFSMETEDTLTYSWGVIDSDIKEAVFNLRVNLFGKVTNYPRKFTIRVVNEFPDSVRAEEGINYRDFPLEYEMPPMVDYVEIPITLLRDSVKKVNYFEVFLEENEEFDFGYMRWMEPQDSLGNPLTPYMYDEHRVIRQNEKFPKPSWWETQENYIGEWSEVKGVLICDIMEIDRKVFQLPLDSDGALTYAKVRFIAIQMADYFYYNETYDENGKLIEMGEDAYM